MVNEAALDDIRRSLFGDIKAEDQFYNMKPHLAHYTSLDVLEKILHYKEIWFSNPLFMNDLKEVRYGITEGIRFVKDNESIGKSLGTAHRRKLFVDAMDRYVTYFEHAHLLDTYVFCLSEHEPDNIDGRLSMWRGYGANGNGVAIVFDTNNIQLNRESPFLMAKVTYGARKYELEWFNNISNVFANLISKYNVPDDSITAMASELFDRLKVFALFTKHIGFEEEKEWRIVYMPERDPQKRLAPMLHYLNGPRGVEPKLKFKVEPTPGVTADDFSFEKIIAAILLGPSTSSPLAHASVKRMVQLISPKLASRLYPSSIPLRPI